MTHPNRHEDPHPMADRKASHVHLELDVDESLAAFDVDIDEGLSTEQVEEQRKIYGMNELEQVCGC